MGNMKKIIFFILFLLLIIQKLVCENYKIGISRLYVKNKSNDFDFFLNIEDNIISVISEYISNDFYALEIEFKKEDFIEILKKIKDNNLALADYEKKVFEEIKDLDYVINIEILFFDLEKEPDFYDTDKFWNAVSLGFKISLIDCKEYSIIEEENIYVEFSSDKDLTGTKDECIRILSKKAKSAVKDLTIFKLKAYPTKIGPIFIWLDKGKNDGLRAQNILIAYEENEYSIIEHTVVKIIKAFDDRSLAIIMYTKGNLTDKYYFIKKYKINLEIQLSGGFSFSDPENNVASTNDYFSILPFANIRALIPVGITFFRPLIQLEFNIFYLDNKLLLPFTFETGCQGEFFIHRFGIDLGFTVGALFAPDKNNNYSLDTVIIRPYIHLSVMPVTTVKLFAEFGYRFYVEGNFYKDWEVNLNGMYLSFGLSVNL